MIPPIRLKPTNGSLHMMKIALTALITAIGIEISEIPRRTSLMMLEVKDEL